IETEFAEAGHLVVSNAKNHRMDPEVPLLVPEVNPDHLELLKDQEFGGGGIIANPNCSTIGLVLALKPLHDAFGLETVHVVTLQALSGAGVPGVASMEIADNVIPFISGEEDKLETEPLKILGALEGSEIRRADIRIGAHCTRVPVTDGHTEAVSVTLRKEATADDVIEAWNEWVGEPQRLHLPTAPARPVQYLSGATDPQPRLHRNLGRGMTVSVGRLRSDPVFDWSFFGLSHNTVRGAAGGALLCAELAVARGALEGVKPPEEVAVLEAS
ncbi:MAG: aspartate-semialdehyde dehydrogenase, partial [bacterium]